MVQYMERLAEEIRNYTPGNEQEECDRAVMLAFLRNHPDCLLRENLTGHFTASVWVVNPERTKTVFVFHRLYDSWSWIGGHADGDADLRRVALKELREETGIVNARLIGEGIFSLETLVVHGHFKHGVYVPGHVHFNVTYLAEADETETLHINEAENTGVRWFGLDEIPAVSNETWMVEHVYRKLTARCKNRV